MMLTLSRGGPIIWLSEDDAKHTGIVDDDWVELSTSTAPSRRGRWSPTGVVGYGDDHHAQEKTINMPGYEITGTRGGIHNSMTRIVLKPTHMIFGGSRS